VILKHTVMKHEQKFSLDLDTGSNTETLPSEQGHNNTRQTPTNKPRKKKEEKDRAI